MKVALILLVVAVATSAMPIEQKTVLVDWEEMKELTKEIQRIVIEKVVEIKKIANDDNKDAGEIISKMMDKAAEKAKVILEEILVKMEAETLTYDEAQKYLVGLKTELEIVKEMVKPELERLTPSEANKIRTIFYDTLVEIQVIVQKILDNLPQYFLHVFPSEENWTEIKENIIEIEMVVKMNVQKVKEISMKADPKVGHEVSKEIDKHTPNAIAIMKEILAEVDAKTLNLLKAEKSLIELKKVFEQVSEAIKPLLKDVPTAAEEIRKVYDEAVKVVKTLADEILEMLSMVFIQVIPTEQDWNTIMRIMKEIRIIVKSSMQNVKDMAMNADPIVGEMMSKEMEMHVPMAFEIMQEIITEINSKTLNFESGKIYLEKLEAILTKVKTVIIKYFKLLEKEVADQIANELNTAFTQAKDLANKIMGMLSINILSIQAVNWDKLLKEVENIRTVATEGVHKIIKIASDSHIDIGKEVAIIMNKYVEMAEQIFSQVVAKIHAKNLTLGEVEKFISQLKEILEQAKEEIKPQMDRLHPIVAKEIINVFNVTYTKVEEIMKVIRAIFTSFNILKSN